jgi:hypothetical protein
LNRSGVLLRQPRRHVRPAQIVLALLAVLAIVALGNGRPLGLGSGEVAYAPADSERGGAPVSFDSRLLLAEESEDDQGEDDPPILLALAYCGCRDGAKVAADDGELRVSPRHWLSPNFATGPPVS